MNEQQLSEAMKLMGAKGGNARAKKLSAERLSEIGKLGGRPRSKARRKKAPKSKHK
jgi:general stress protein YciG